MRHEARFESEVDVERGSGVGSFELLLNLVASMFL
jgi:hypothetical protein